MLKERQTEQLIVQLFDHQPDAVVWYQPVFDGENERQTLVDLEVHYANHAAARLVNASRSEMMGERLRSTSQMDAATIDLIFTQCREVWETGEPLVYTYYSAGFDKYFDVQRSKVDGGVLCITRDQTFLVQSELLAKQDRDLLHSILNASINGLFAVTAVRDEAGRIVDFRFLKCNKRFLQVAQKPEVAIIGQRYLATFPTAAENGMFELMVQVVESGEPIEREVPYHGEGINGWFLVSMAPLGKDGLVETFADITESKLSEARIARSAEKFRTVVHSSKAGMFTLQPVRDVNGDVTDFRFGIVNQTVASYIGQTAEVLADSLASVYFPAYTANGLFTLYKDNYLTGTPYNFDFHYEGGYDVFFNIDVVKMGDEVLVTFTDHTALKRLQQEQEKMVADLKRSNESLEEFSSAASHDLKEPLRKVIFFIDRLKEKLHGRLSEEETHLMERVQAATERMKLLVDDLLEYSRLGRGEHLEKEDVNLNNKIGKILSDLELLITEKQAVVNIGNLPVVKGYRRQLQQLFQNLLSNALKYQKPGVPPVIDIRAAIVRGEESGLSVLTEDAEKNFHLIEVTDNGIGFEQEYAERIFQMFTRLHGNREYAGTGIGLSIAKKVVENHHGYIWAEGRPGLGATFRVLLPAD